MATNYDEATWIKAHSKKFKKKAKGNPKGGSLDGIENGWYNKDGLFYSNNDEVLTMNVSNSYIGRIIGKFGKKIRDIQSRSGAIILVNGDTKALDNNVEIKLIGSKSNIKHAKKIIEWLIMKWKPQVENQRKSENQNTSKQSKMCGKPLEKQEEEQKMSNKFYYLKNTENISLNTSESNYHEFDNVTENLSQSASINKENRKMRNQNKIIVHEYFGSLANKAENKSDNLFQWNEVVEREKWDASWVYETKNWNAKIAETVNKNVKQTQESVNELDNDKTDSNPNCSHELKCWNEDAKNKSQNSNSEYISFNLSEPVWQELNPGDNIILPNTDVHKNTEQPTIENLNKTYSNANSYHSDGNHSSKLKEQNTSNSSSELNELVEHEKWDAGWIYKSKNWNAKTADSNNKIQEIKSSDLNGSENLGNGTIAEKSLSSHNNTDPSQLNEFLDQNQAKDLFDWNEVVEEEKWDATWIHETENWNTKIAEIENKCEKQEEKLDNEKSDCNLTWSEENEYWNEDIKSNKNQSSNTQYFSFSLTDSFCNDLDLDLENKNDDEFLSVNSNDSWNTSKNWENETEEIQEQNKSNLENYFVYELASQNITTYYLDESQSSKVLDENKPDNDCNVENQYRLTNYFCHDVGLEDMTILPVANADNTNDTWNASKNWENKIEEIQNQNESNLEEYFVHEVTSRNSTNSSYLSETQSSELLDESKLTNNCNSNCSDEVEYCNDIKSNTDEHSNTAYFSLSLNESVDMTTLPTSNVNEICENQENECEGSCNNMDSCSLNESELSKNLDENKYDKQFKWIGKEEANTAWKDEIDYCEARLAEYIKSLEQEDSSDVTSPEYICNSNCSDKIFSVNLTESVCQELDPDDRINLQTSNVHKNNQESPNIYCEEDIENESGEIQNRIEFNDKAFLDYMVSSQNSFHLNHSNGSQFSKSLQEDKASNLIAPQEITEHKNRVSEWINASDNWNDDIAEIESEGKGEEKESLYSSETVYMELDDAKVDDDEEHWNENVEKYKTEENLYLRMMEYICKKLEEDEKFDENEIINNYESENLHYSKSWDTNINEMQSPSRNSDKTNNTEISYLSSSSSDENLLNNLFGENDQVVQEKLDEVWVQENENWNIEIEERENQLKNAEKEAIYCELVNKENEFCNQDLQTESANIKSFKLDWDNTSSNNENSNSKTEEIINHQVIQPLSENIPNVLQSGCRIEKDLSENEDQQQKISDNCKSDVNNKLDNYQTTLKYANVTGFKWSDLVIQEEKKIEMEKIIRSYLKEGIWNEYWKSENKTNKNATKQQTQFDLTNSIYPNIYTTEMMKPTFNVDHHYDLLIYLYNCKNLSSISEDCSKTENNINTNKRVTNQEEHFNSNFPQLKTDFTSYLKQSPPENTTTNTVQCEYYKWSNNSEDWNNLSEETENKNNSIENGKTEINYNSTKSVSPASTTDSNEVHSISANTGQCNWEKISEEILTNQEYKLMGENDCNDKWSSDREDWNNPTEETENKNNSIENVKTEINFSSTKCSSPESTTDFTSHLINSNEIHSGKSEISSPNSVQSIWVTTNAEQLIADQEYELICEDCYNKLCHDNEESNNPSEKIENDSSENLITQEEHFSLNKSISSESTTDLTSNEIQSEKILNDNLPTNENQCIWNKIIEEKLIAYQENELICEDCYDKLRNNTEKSNIPSEKSENDSWENLILQKEQLSLNKSISSESTTDFTSNAINSNKIHSEKILNENLSTNEIQCNRNKITEEKQISGHEYELICEDCYDKLCNDTEESNNLSEKNENDSSQSLIIKEEHFSLNKSTSSESTTGFPPDVINSNEIHSEKILNENSPTNANQSIWNKITEEKLIADQECQLICEDCHDKLRNDTEGLNNPSDNTKNNSTENVITQEEHFILSKSISSDSTTDFPPDVINSNEIHSEKILNKNLPTNVIQCIWNEISEEKLIADQEYVICEDCYDYLLNYTEEPNNPSEKAENNSSQNLITHKEHFSLKKSIFSESTTDFPPDVINSNEIHSEKILNENSPTNEIQCMRNKITEEKLISGHEYKLICEDCYDKLCNDTEESNNLSEKIENDSSQSLIIQEEHFSLNKSTSSESSTDLTSNAINSNKIHSEKLLNENSPTGIHCIRNKITEEKQIADQEYELICENCYDKLCNDTEESNNLSENTENNSSQNLLTQEEHLNLSKSTSSESTTDSTSYAINSNKIHSGEILPETTSENAVQCIRDKLSEEKLISDQEFEVMDESSSDNWSNDTEDSNNSSEESENNSIENLSTKEENFSSTKSTSSESTSDLTSHVINSNEMHSEELLTKNTTTGTIQCNWDEIICEEKLIADQEFELTDHSSDDNWSNDTEDCNNPSEESENNSIENLSTKDENLSSTKPISPTSTIDLTPYLINLNEMRSGKTLPETTSENSVQCIWDKLNKKKLISDPEFELMDENSYDDWSNDTEDNPSEESKNNSIENLLTTKENLNSTKSVSSASTTDFTSYLINSNEIHSGDIQPENTITNTMNCIWDEIIREEKLISDQEFELKDQSSYYDKWNWNNPSEETENKNNSIESLDTDEENFSSTKSSTGFTNNMHSEKIPNENLPTNEDECDWNNVIGEKPIVDEGYEFIQQYYCDKMSNRTEDWNNQTVETENKTSLIENVTSNEAHVYEKFFGKLLNQTTLITTDQYNRNEKMESRPSLDQEYELFGDNCLDMCSNNTEKIVKTENEKTQEADFLQFDTVKSTDCLENSSKISSGKTSTNTDECNWNEFFEKWTCSIADWNEKIVNTEDKCKEQELLSFGNPLHPIQDLVKRLMDEQRNKNKTPNTSISCDWNNMIEKDESFIHDTIVMDAEDKKSKDEVSQPNNDGIACGSSEMECNWGDPVVCNVINEPEEKNYENNQVNEQLNSKQQKSKFVPTQVRTKRRKKKRYSRR